jgi:hypothetical protein
MTGGGYRTKEIFTGLRIFSAGGHPTGLRTKLIRKRKEKHFFLK